ncbi:MAG: hypothetical protein AVDCRST_MAG11-2390, partial [uncultured Gemmatimonadaceae bacterium]
DLHDTHRTRARRRRARTRGQHRVRAADRHGHGQGKRDHAQHEHGADGAHDVGLAESLPRGRDVHDEEVRRPRRDDGGDGRVGEDRPVEAHGRLRPRVRTRVPRAPHRRDAAVDRLQGDADDVRRARDVRRERGARAHLGRDVGPVRQGGGELPRLEPRARHRDGEADGGGRAEDVRRADRGDEGRPIRAIHRAAHVRHDEQHRRPGSPGRDGDDRIEAV